MCRGRAAKTGKLPGIEAVARKKEEKRMKLTNEIGFRAVKWIGLCLLAFLFSWLAAAQGVTTTTVQGTVYLANGQPGAGSLHISWPAFTTASNQSVAAGSVNVTIGVDGFLSVNLAPNLGATPAGLFYTSVYNMSDGSTNTEYRRLNSA